MDNIQNKLEIYNNKLNELQQKCSDAEKEIIVAETNLKSCTKQRDDLISELEAFTNCEFENIPALLEKEVNEFDSIMDRLTKINLNEPITQSTVDELNSIINDFNIVEASL